MPKQNQSANSLLRQIPKVDELLHHPSLVTLSGEGSVLAVTDAVRQVLDELRIDILSGKLEKIPGTDVLANHCIVQYKKNQQPNLRRVINGTGVILHTNLGRAPLAAEALELAALAGQGYSTLEYEVSEGKRGSRQSHVEQLLIRLTGAEAAMVVNNNAAAVMLILSVIAGGSEVVISRGELVEIGGSFRIPDVMTQAGCRLREVGTTNKTHIQDYESAIVPELTGALMKIHTSNYKIMGFTQAVSVSELVQLGKRCGLPVIADLGSGCLLPLDQYGIIDEPTVADSVAAGIDAVCFSGDKLLGGPQAGIIVGRAEYLSRMKRHPLARALRIDKLTLAALEGTLRLYLDPAEACAKIPVLRMLAEDQQVLYQKAEKLQELLGRNAGIIPEHSQVGGGSVPTQMLPTFAVAFSAADFPVQTLEKRLRLSEPPIVGRIAHDKFLLDVRTLDERDFPCIAERIRVVLDGRDVE